MDLFPEIMSGDVGLTALQFATGTADVAGQVNNCAAELFNPAVANPQATSVLIQATVTGFIVWGIQTGVQTFRVLKSAAAGPQAGIATAASAGPNFMDGRIPTATTPSLSFKQGNLAAFAGLTEVFRCALPAGSATQQQNPILIPFNWDLVQGQGLILATDVTTRFIVTAIWTERQQTA